MGVGTGEGVATWRSPGLRRRLLAVARPGRAAVGNKRTGSQEATADRAESAHNIYNAKPKPPHIVGPFCGCLRKPALRPPRLRTLRGVPVARHPRTAARPAGSGQRVPRGSLPSGEPWRSCHFSMAVSGSHGGTGRDGVCCSDSLQAAKPLLSACRRVLWCAQWCSYGGTPKSPTAPVDGGATRRVGADRQRRGRIRIITAHRHRHNAKGGDAADLRPP